MSKRLGGIIGCKYETSPWHYNGLYFLYSPMVVVVRLGQKYNIGEKPTSMLFLTYIQRTGCQPDRKTNYFTRWPIPLLVC